MFELTAGFFQEWESHLWMPLLLQWSSWYIQMSFEYTVEELLKGKNIGGFKAVEVLQRLAGSLFYK